MLSKKQQKKKAFWAKYNGEKRTGFGKIHTKTCWVKNNRKRMHFGQNTMEKNCIWGKIQWRKGQKSLGKINVDSRQANLKQKIL